MIDSIHDFLANSKDVFNFADNFLTLVSLGLGLVILAMIAILGYKLTRMFEV